MTPLLSLVVYMAIVTWASLLAASLIRVEGRTLPVASFAGCHPRARLLSEVNTNVMIVIASLPLKNFAKALQGARTKVFEQKLEGKWEQPADEGSAKQ